jgi:hypothetical protein
MEGVLLTGGCIYLGYSFYLVSSFEHVCPSALVRSTQFNAFFHHIYTTFWMITPYCPLPGLELSVCLYVNVPAGQLCVAKGELQMASDSFKIVLDEDGNNFPALLGQVIFRLFRWSHEAISNEIWILSNCFSCGVYCKC